MIVIWHGRQRADDDIVGEYDYFHETRISSEMLNDGGVGEVDEVWQKEDDCVGVGQWRFKS